VQKHGCCFSFGPITYVIEVEMKKILVATSGALSASAAMGVVILLTDGYLWAAAPSHAYGLVAFVIIDLGLAAAIWRATRPAMLGAALLGLVQFTAMTGDVFAGQPAGLSLSLWEKYLLGDIYFVGLLLLQLVVVDMAFLGLVYRRSADSAPLATPRQ
jgi:hypothetical protein